MATSEDDAMCCSCTVTHDGTGIGLKEADGVTGVRGSAAAGTNLFGNFQGGSVTINRME